MKKKLLSFLALFISLSIYFSCTDEGVEVIGLQRSNPDSDLLAYAKNLVGEKGEGCSLIDLQKGSTNSRAVTDYSTVATPLWDKAKKEQYGDEEVLIVPLQSENDIHSSMYFEEEEMGRLYQTKTFSKLVVRNKNGHTVTQVFTYLPGRNYAKNRQAVLDTMGFSPLAIKYYGTILISDLTGKFQQGFYYERGIPTIHLTPKKHTHTAGSRSINDSTECDHHEHSHSMDIRLRLSGNMRIASRNINEGEEVDFPCMFCGQSALTCSCFTVEGNYIYCDDCGQLKGQCICEYLCPICRELICICEDTCPICGEFDCICCYCPLCSSDPCVCGANNDYNEESCEFCNRPYCKGECQNTEPDDEEPEEETKGMTIEKLKKEIIEKYGNNCGFVAAWEATNGLNNLIDVIEKKNLESSYAYDAKNKALLVPIGWDGDITRTSFPEEIVHYLQDNIYSGGIGQYANGAGKSNIEFEAKVITDLILLKKGRELYRRESKVLVEDTSMMIPTANYNKFLRSIRNGKMKNEDYTKFLNDFSKYAKNIEYRNNVNTNLIPLIINNYGSKFTSDKCGTND